MWKKRTEKGGIALYPAFPLCFMTNKMFFQRLNIMRHDVSGSSQTLGVNVLYPKMSCFHKPFLLYFAFGVFSSNTSSTLRTRYRSILLQKSLPCLSVYKIKVLWLLSMSSFCQTLFCFCIIQWTLKVRRAYCIHYATQNLKHTYSHM